VVSGSASAVPYGGAETEPAAPPSYQTITTERIGLVQRITLNRPEKRNALSPQLQDELIHAVREAETSNEVGAIVLRGAGPSFCSGYDLSPGRAAAQAKRPMTTEEDAHNKRIVNLGVELMGRGTMQVLAGIHDALAHQAPEAAEFAQQIREHGVRQAVAERDAKFA
jgi:1,4-dihydroxy-2-naphthoyl-CoA synthase